MKQNNEYFKYVAKNSNLLIFGDESLDEFSDIFKYFNNFIFQEMVIFNVENLSATISNFDIDVIIITAKQNKSDISEILTTIKETRDLHIILYCDQDKLYFDENLVNISDTIFTKKISKEALQYKIYNSINDRIASSHIDSTAKGTAVQRTKYRDAFDTEVMFIAEELRDISTSIDNGDISQEVFDRMEKNISKVSFIINGHLMSSKTIKKLINKLDVYLKNFDLEEIDISCIDGFEHLSNLIRDVAVFLDKYFITREMDDIYVVEDSLENSFEYVKLVFEGKQDSDDDDSEMEFF